MPSAVSTETVSIGWVNTIIMSVDVETFTSPSSGSVETTAGGVVSGPGPDGPMWTVTMVLAEFPASSQAHIV